MEGLRSQLFPGARLSRNEHRQSPGCGARQASPDVLHRHRTTDERRNYRRLIICAPHVLRDPKHQQAVPCPDHIPVLQKRTRDPASVYEGPVLAAQILQLCKAVPCMPVQPWVLSGQGRVVQGGSVLTRCTTQNSVPGEVNGLHIRGCGGRYVRLQGAGE